MSFKYKYSAEDSYIEMDSLDDLKKLTALVYGLIGPVSLYFERGDEEGTFSVHSSKSGMLLGIVDSLPPDTTAREGS